MSLEGTLTEQNRHETLHQKYVTFMNDMNQHLEESILIKNLDQFVLWWESLSSDVHAKLLQDYSKGYSCVIQETRQEIEKMLG